MMKVQFHKDIKNPIFAYTIKDRKGTEITGTNTVLENQNLEEGREGTRVTVCFEQVMNLQSGQYLLSLGCTGYEMDELCISGMYASDRENKVKVEACLFVGEQDREAFRFLEEHGVLLTHQISPEYNKKRVRDLVQY